MSEMQASTESSDQPEGRAKNVRAEFSCSFCGKKQRQVWRLIAGPGVYICSECVLLCVEMLVEGPTVNLDDPDIFHVAARRADGTIEQLSFGPLPEPGVPAAGTPGGTPWLQLCAACGAMNAGSGLETCLHCAAALPRSGEPLQLPVTPWPTGFSRPQLRSFTSALRATLELAQEEAALLRHDYIGTEHLLLGLLREGTSTAAVALTARGVALETVRQAVIEIIGLGMADSEALKGYSQRGREVVRGALALAKQQHQAMVGPEHLLLALLAERQGVAAMALAALGTDLDEIQRQVEQRLLPTAGNEPATAESLP
jgi:hypothetical protein